MSRSSRDSGNVSVPAVLAVLAALIGGGAAVTASSAVISSQQPAAETVGRPAAIVEGPSDAILEYGGLEQASR
ncbi:MAG: hypothetical protein U0Q19_16940 [Kineosporiaceae bacterium]